MPATIEGVVASVREDCRSDYLWDTEHAGKALGVHPNKFGIWWYRTRDKLVALAKADPGNTAAELLAVIVEAERQRDEVPAAAADRDPPEHTRVPQAAGPADRPRARRAV